MEQQDISSNTSPGRSLLMNLNLLGTPTIKDVVLQNQQAQVQRRKLKDKERTFQTGDQVLARSYNDGQQ